MQYIIHEIDNYIYKIIAMYTTYRNNKIILNVILIFSMIMLTACNTLEVRLQNHELITFSNEQLISNDKKLALSQPDNLCHIPQLPHNEITANSQLNTAQKIISTAITRYGEQAVELVPILNAEAEKQRQHGRFAEAELLFRRAIIILEKSGTKSQQDLATVYSNFGVSMRQSGQFAEAEKLLKRALALRSQIYSSNDVRRITTEFNLGVAQVAGGRYVEAKKYLENALEALPPNNLLIIDVLDNLAVLYRAIGELQQAEMSLERALQLARTNPQVSWVQKVSLLNGRADLYLAIGDIAGAAILLQEATQNIAALDINIIAETFNNIAQLRQRQQHFPQARFCQEQSLTLITAHYGSVHPKTLLAKHNLGVLLYRMGDFDAAATLLQEVLAQRESTEPLSLATADTLDALAGVAQTQGHAATARDLLQRALQLRTRLLPKHHPDLATSHTNLAVLEASASNYAVSINAFATAAAVDGHLLEQVMGFASEEQKIAVLTEKNRHLYALFSLVTQYLVADPKAVRLVADLWLKRKGLILEAQRHYRVALVNRDGHQAAQLLQKLSAARQELAEFIYAPDVSIPVAEQYQSLSRLENTIDALDAELMRICPSYEEERILTTANVSKVAAQLPPHSVLIELIRFDRFKFTELDPRHRWGDAEYLAILINSQLSNGVKLVPLGTAPAIEKLLQELLSNIGDDAEAIKNTNLYGQQLYTSVFLPLEQEFPSGIKEILFAPDGQFNLLPLEILRTVDGQFLTQKYLISYLATGRDLLRRKRAAGNNSQAFLLGDPDFDLKAVQKPQVLRQLGIQRAKTKVPDRGLRLLRDGLAFIPLPWTRQEVESIRNIVGANMLRLYLGQEAVEDVFDTLSKPKFMHIATHGFFLSDLALPAAPADSRSGNPAYSVVNNPLLRAGLAFAGANQGLSGTAAGHDGILTAEEVLNLDLRGTALVVLSACETGLGQLVNGEGVYGLRRAFAAAGAQGLIISLWPVPDQETQELMVELYQGIMRGLAPRQALQRARHIVIERVRTRYGNDSPFYWGGFIYQGPPTLQATSL